MSLMPTFFFGSHEDKIDAPPPLPARPTVPQANPRILDFDELATQLDLQLVQYRALERSNEDSLVKIRVLEKNVQVKDATIQVYENQLSQIQNTHKAELQRLAQMHQSRVKELQTWQSRLANAQNAIQSKNQKIAFQRDAIIQLESRSAVLAQECKRQQNQANAAFEEQRIFQMQLAEKAHETRLTPKGVLQSAFAHQQSLPVQPFVVLLVDGDSYGFLPDLVRDKVNGGARTAQCLSAEMFKYILRNPQIPQYARVIVRIFCNGRPTRINDAGFRENLNLHTFMVTFSETQPLFDYFDCGSGKERADTKIRENFELFASNPYCSAVLLAVCYDNGFVRMLEPYQYMKAMQRKIALVKAGHTAHEFSRLAFDYVEFPTVFKPRLDPLLLVARRVLPLKPRGPAFQGMQASTAAAAPSLPGSAPELIIRATSDLVGLFDRRLQPSSGSRWDRLDPAAPELKTPIIEALTREISTLQHDINALDTALGRTIGTGKGAKSRRAGLRAAALQRRSALAKLQEELRAAKEKPQPEFEID